MGFVRENVEIVGSRKNKQLLALFDTGAYRNYIRKVMFDGETPDDIGFHTFEGTKEIILANGSNVPGDWVRFREVRIVDAYLKNPLFIVVEDLTWDIIIGVELMQTLGVVIDPPNERLLISNKREQ